MSKHALDSSYVLVPYSPRANIPVCRCLQCSSVEMMIDVSGGDFKWRSLPLHVVFIYLYTLLDFPCRPTNWCWQRSAWRRVSHSMSHFIKRSQSAFVARLSRVHVSISLKQSNRRSERTGKKKRKHQIRSTLSSLHIKHDYCLYMRKHSRLPPGDIVSNFSFRYKKRQPKQNFVRRIFCVPTEYYTILNWYSSINYVVLFGRFVFSCFIHSWAHDSCHKAGKLFASLN